jgi:hypothetical protein
MGYPSFGSEFNNLVYMDSKFNGVVVRMDNKSNMN